MADCPIEPYWHMFTRLQAAVQELPPTPSDWQETSEEKSGANLQLKLDGQDRHFERCSQRWRLCPTGRVIELAE